MKSKKILLIALVMVLLLMPEIAKAEIDINQAIVDDAKTFETVDGNLGEFKDPLSIFYIDRHNNKEEITEDFKEGIRNLNDRTAVGVRDFVNIIPNTKIFWNQEHKMVVVITSAGGEVILPIDKNIIYVNGDRKTIDAPATLDNNIDRTFLPLRTLAEVLRYEVEYDPEIHGAILKEPLNFLGGNVEPDVPSSEEIFGPVNEMFKNSNDENSEDINTTGKFNNLKIEEPETIKRVVNTELGRMEKDYAYKVEENIVDALNEYRRKNGLNPLDISYDIGQMSDTRAAEFEETNSTNRPNGLSWNSIGDINYEFSASTKNVGNLEEELIRNWEKQFSNNMGILDPNLKEFNVSAVYNNNKLYIMGLFSL